MNSKTWVETCVLIIIYKKQNCMKRIIYIIFLGLSACTSMKEQDESHHD